MIETGYDTAADAMIDGKDMSSRLCVFRAGRPFNRRAAA
jgi:hypothetical protein